MTRNPQDGPFDTRRALGGAGIEIFNPELNKPVAVVLGNTPTSQQLARGFARHHDMVRALERTYQFLKALEAQPAPTKEAVNLKRLVSDLHESVAGRRPKAAG